MSEIKEGWSYDLYDFTKSVYIFSHMKTNLVDDLVQIFEKIALKFLNGATIFIGFIVFLKIIIIVAYFTLGQASLAIFRFIKTLFITKCNIYVKSSCKSVIYFLVRIFKKIFTFNFYIFQNKIITTFMICIFIINILSISRFSQENLDQIINEEKDDNFINFYFLSFEFNLLIEVICYMFYSVRNIGFGFVLSICYFIVLNLIIYFSFLISERYEYLNGAFLLGEPQKILNIIIFLILMILKIDCLIKIVKYNKESK